MANAAEDALKLAEYRQAQLQTVQDVAHGELSVENLNKLVSIFDSFNLKIPGSGLVQKMLAANAFSTIFFPSAAGKEGVVNKILKAKQNPQEAKDTLGKLVGALEDMFKMQPGTLGFIAKRCEAAVDEEVEKQQQPQAAQQPEVEAAAAKAQEDKIKALEAQVVALQENAAQGNEAANQKLTEIESAATSKVKATLSEAADQEIAANVVAELPAEAKGAVQSLQAALQTQPHVSVNISVSGQPEAVNDILNRIGGVGRSDTVEQQQQGGDKPQRTGKPQGKPRGSRGATG